eukprot:3813439-Rhodomonas_salina.3
MSPHSFTPAGRPSFWCVRARLVRRQQGLARRALRTQIQEQRSRSAMCSSRARLPLGRGCEPRAWLRLGVRCVRSCSGSESACHGCRPGCRHAVATAGIRGDSESEERGEWYSLRLKLGTGSICHLVTALDLYPDRGLLSTVSESSEPRSPRFTNSQPAGSERAHVQLTVYQSRLPSLANPA